MIATPIYCAVMLFMAHTALAEMKSGFLQLWWALWPILTATTVMAAVVLFLREFAFAEQPGSALLRLIFLSVSGVVAYSATLFAMGGPVMIEGVEVLGWVFRRQRAES